MFKLTLCDTGRYPTPTTTTTSTPATYTDTYVYDAYGRLAQKGGSTYTYGTNHPHAATSAHGWTYNYNDNGDVTSKTDGVDTYTFTYTRELKIATISLNSQVLHRFGYDANGNRVAERRSDGTVVFSVGGYYEYSQNGSETHTTLFYGSEALRVDGELRFILTDHLGSTSIITDEIGEYLAEQRYDAWGSTRYVDGVIPTDKQYTSQRISEDIGLYDYKARWYDPDLGRFLMEDTIIPNQGVMKLDRYAYVNNRPISFVDTLGMECELYLDDGSCAVNRTPLGAKVVSKPKVGNTIAEKKIEEPPWKPPLGYLLVSDDYEGCSGGVCNHVGTDYSVPIGSDLYASGRGHVVIADVCSKNPCVSVGDLNSVDVNHGYGNVIVIEYPYTSIPKVLRDELGLEPGQSVYVVYAHLEDISVEPGDIVSSGEIIGHTGNSGNSTAAHLHMEVKIFPYHSIPPGMMCGDISCYHPGFNDNHPGWYTIPDPDARYSYLIPPSEIHRKDPALLHNYYEWPWP